MICHDNKIIYIHIPNTAGTSLEKALMRNKWEYDYRGKHLDWKEMKEKYSEYWDEYFKITVVRNPWSWLAALYRTHKERRQYEESWNDFLKYPRLGIDEQTTIIQSEIFGPEMDFILRFEDIANEYKRLCEKLKIKSVNKFPHKQKNKPRPHYSTFYTDEQVEIVRKKFKKDIELFNYEFEERRV